MVRICNIVIAVWYVDNTETNGIPDKPPGAVHFEMPLQFRTMLLHRSYLDVEYACDLLVRLIVDDQLQNFALPQGETDFAAFRRFIPEVLHHGGGDVSFSVGCGPDGNAQLFFQRAFSKYPAAPAFRACQHNSSSLLPVRTMTRVGSFFRTTRVIRSMPLKSGINGSTRATLGWSFSMRAIPSHPIIATPRISTPWMRPAKYQIATATSASSSITTVEIVRSTKKSPSNANDQFV